MFVALEVACQMVEGLGPIVEKIRRRDPKLADQIRRASASVALNIAEGRERVGRDREHLFRIASGSRAETEVALRVAIAYAGATREELRATTERLHHLRGLLWGLTRDRASARHYQSSIS
jgi:four helix bundle protein